jgi:putative ABC transport system permease protein
MIKNYFTIALRNLWRNKLYTIVNTLGLSLGIAALVWGIQTYRYSYSFDSFHQNKNNVFRILTKTEGSDGIKGICPSALASVAQQDFSGIEEVVRWNTRGLDVKGDQNEPLAADAAYTDPAFFKLFNFPLVKGTVKLEDKSTVVITEDGAKKYFGDTDPVGKTLVFHSGEIYRRPLTVTGILKNAPVNSTLQFEIITHFDNYLKADGAEIKNDDWYWFANAVFLKLSRPTDAARLARNLMKYLPLQKAAREDIRLTAFELRSVAWLAKQSSLVESNSMVERPQDSATYGTLILALLVLLSACLNFANTTVAQSNGRLKEIGVRKVMGSSYRQVMIQQLLECSLIVVLALFFSIIINSWWLPVFNSMFGFIKIAAPYLTDMTLLAILAIIVLAVTLVAGGYPAFYISRFNATSIFRGSVKFGGRNLFSRVLLGLQIVIAFITVIAGMAFYRNAEFQKNYDYGYDKDNIIGFFVQTESAYTALRNEMSKLPGVEQIAGTRQHIGFWERNPSLEAEGKKKESWFLEVGKNYINTLKLQLVAGRDFNAEGQGDVDQSMLINQKLAFEFGWKGEEAIGKKIKLDSTVSTVVGVLKDFSTGNLFDPVMPFAIKLTEQEKYMQLIIRTKPGEVNKVFDQSRTAWAALFPMKPFRGFYQNEAAAESLRTNASIAKIFFWFAIISVLMAATGMFALVSLTVLKKTREIAIRKVVGANARHIYQLVLKGYLLIFFLAAGLGCYAGYSLSRLLMDLIFKINSGVAVSTIWISIACVTFIALTTIGSRVGYSFGTKPTEVLK